MFFVFINQIDNVIMLLLVFNEIGELVASTEFMDIWLNVSQSLEHILNSFLYFVFI